MEDKWKNRILLDNLERPKSELVPLSKGVLSARGTKLFNVLQGDIKGQEKAVRDVVRALELEWSGLREFNKPISVILAIGPSGTGKTHLARMLAKHLLGSSDAITRIPCEAANERHAVSDILGAPPGYIGHGNPSPLTQFNIDRFDFMKKFLQSDFATKVMIELRDDIKRSEELKSEKESELNDLKKNTKMTEEAKGQKEEQLRDEIEDIDTNIEEAKRLKKNSLSAMTDQQAEVLYKKYGHILGPFLSVILFDEIEKADEYFRKMLYGVFDEGILRLRSGQVTNLRNSIILLTSNVGESEIRDRLSGRRIGFLSAANKSRGVGNLDQEMYEIAREAATRFFEAPFLGRISILSVFRPLNRKTMMEILELKLRELKQVLVETKVPVGLVVDGAVMDFLLDKAMKYPDEGARVLERRVTEKIKPELAALINAGSIKRGDVIHVKLSGRGNKKDITFFNQPNLDKTK
ncbi:MAG: AAA family ATPase [bacterium]|nr:AAA family ATPase [bacterium]